MFTNGKDRVQKYTIAPEYGWNQPPIMLLQCLFAPFGVLGSISARRPRKSASGPDAGTGFSGCPGGGSRTGPVENTMLTGCVAGVRPGCRECSGAGGQGGRRARGGGFLGVGRFRHAVADAALVQDVDRVGRVVRLRFSTTNISRKISSRHHASLKRHELTYPTLAIKSHSPSYCYI